MFGALVIVFLIVAVLSTIAGVRLLMRLLRRKVEPRVPVARDANPDLATRAAGKVERGVLSASKAVGVALGTFLIAWPWLLFFAFGGSSSHESMSKGRVLRIRRRARLPEAATGEGWCDEAVTLGSLSAKEREVLGALWLLTARMEHASIAAFSQLSLQLSALGAPARLLAWSHRAALEEIGHAQRCFAVASAIAGTPQKAGPIVELAQASTGSIDLARLAVGSLIDGCLAEGMASDVAAAGAELAVEPAIREVLALIAREEAGHAELAWAVLAWCLEAGDVRDVVSARVEALTQELAPRLPDIAGLADADLARHGVIGQDALGAIAEARCRAVQARARQLLVRGEALAA